jgi:hypothetical protein
MHECMRYVCHWPVDQDAQRPSCRLTALVGPVGKPAAGCLPACRRLDKPSPVTSALVEVATGQLGIGGDGLAPDLPSLVFFP